MSDRVTLSASRIKTAQSCSWLYWAKYKLKLPDKSNHGALRGTCCHEVFEILSEPQMRKDYDKIIFKQDVFASAKIKKIIQNRTKELGVSDEANLNQIKSMIMNGLNYDFFGQKNGSIKETFTEKDFDFDINENGLNFKIKGFIDRLFIYNDDSALIRDYKSSKEKFKGKDLEDNVQDLMYVLAAKRMFPNINKINSEFLFIKFQDDAVQMPDLSDEELLGFQQQLTFIQSYLDNFDEKTATSKLAAKADYPKDNSFSGPLMCGRAKSSTEKKKDGTPMWACGAKFAFEFIYIKDADGKIIDSCFLEDKDAYMKKYPDKKFTKVKYNGCPAFR